MPPLSAGALRGLRAEGRVPKEMSGSEDRGTPTVGLKPKVVTSYGSERSSAHSPGVVAF